MSLLDFSVTTRESRMSKLAAGERIEDFGAQRRCEAAECVALLSRYNPSGTCGVHRGWMTPPSPRTRR